MSDVVELLLVSLAVVLGGAAFAIGAQVIRAAWREARPAAAPAVNDRRAPRPGRDVRLLRGIAAFEAFKALAVLAAACGLLALLRQPPLLHAASALVDQLGPAVGRMLAGSSLDHWLAAERVPVLLGALGYAALRLAEAWGLWHARPWGEALGATSGALYLPFETRHLMHRPGLQAATVLVLNLAVIAFLVWRLRRRASAAR